MQLSVIIPVYNEEKRIKSTLICIMEYLEKKNYSYEIIVVDDGSKDGTIKIINHFVKSGKVQLLRNKENKGKGHAVKKGVLNAQGDYILFSDVDLSTPIEELEKLLKWLKKGFDIAIGSRGLKESDVQIHQPWYREKMGKMFNLLVRMLVIKGIKDTQCGFKCFEREIAQRLFSKQLMEKFSFDVEILYLARKESCSIKEVPVRWYNNPQTRVSAFKDSIFMFLDLIKIKINDWKGRYKNEVISNNTRL